MRAWHLAAAATGPDARAAAALEQAGIRAQQRSAYSVAAAAFERAARLTEDDRERGLRLVAAAEAAWLAGDPVRVHALLDDAEPSAAEDDVIARIEYLRGDLAMKRGPVMDGYPLVVAAAERIAPKDPDAAVMMLAQAVQGAFFAGDTAAMVAAARRAATLADGQTSGAARSSARCRWESRSSLEGDGEAGIAAARRAVEIFERSTELHDDPRLLAWGALGPLWLREDRAGRWLIDLAFEQVRDARRSVCCRPCCTTWRAIRPQPTSGLPPSRAMTSASGSRARSTSGRTSPRGWPASRG